MTTGWPPGLLQDDSRELGRWFASRIDARRVVRQVCAEIERERMTTEPKLPPLPKPRESERYFWNHSREEMHAYGLQCFEAGRPQWVSVAESMPSDEPGSPAVVFYAPDLRNPCALWLGVYRDGKWMSCGYEVVNVTHYMHLPEPPKA